MNRLGMPVLVLMALIGAAGGLVAANAWQTSLGSATQSVDPAAAPLTCWLATDQARAAQLAPLETAYRKDRAALEAALAAEREALAKLLESTDVSDELIREQVERVLTTNNALERRTAEFLIAARPHLDPAERTRLLRHFAAGVREAGGYRWRHGQSAGNAGPDARPGRHGRGAGGGRGFGASRERP